jgi:hypothetical protein
VTVLVICLSVVGGAGGCGKGEKDKTAAENPGANGHAAKQNEEAPPITRAIYNQLRIGMRIADMSDIVGGKPFKEDMTQPRLPSNDIRITQHYRAVGRSGATVTLIFETPANHSTALELVKKSESGLEK